MSAVGLLNCVNRQGADRVNGQRIQLLSGHQRLFTGYHAARAPSGTTLLLSELFH
jgi:hypothetical protein